MLFTFAVFVGGAISIVTFRYRSDQIGSYFNMPSIRGFQLALTILAYMLPTLVFYVVFYLLNRIFIRVFDASDLKLAQKAILKRLVEAAIHGHVIHAKPTDLMEETAWLSMKGLWRPE